MALSYATQHHAGAIGIEVARLKSIALDIEKRAANLVDEIDMQKQQREGLDFGSGASTYYVYVFKRNSSQQARLRKLAAKYETWYNRAVLVCSSHLSQSQYLLGKMIIVSSRL